MGTCQKYVDLLGNTGEAFINSVVSLNPCTSIAVGATRPVGSTKHGIIIRTTDGGNTWTRVFASPLNSHFFGIQSYSSNILWVVGCIVDGDNGIVHYSEDGGCTWSANVFPPSSIGIDYSVFCFYGILIVDPCTIFISGRVQTSNQFAVWKTINKGSNWLKQTATLSGSPTHISLNSLYSGDGKTVWVAGWGTNGAFTEFTFQLYKTENGDTAAPTWQFIASGMEQASGLWNSITGMGTQYLWIAGGNTTTPTTTTPYLRGSRDGGNSWTTLPLPTSSIVRNFPASFASAVAVVPNQGIWVQLVTSNLGEGSIFSDLVCSSDGGCTWKSQYNRIYPSTIVDTAFTPGQSSLSVRGYCGTLQIWSIVACSNPIKSTFTSCETFSLVKGCIP